MQILYLVPARGGSKRIPDKNIKSLNGIPLINYTLNTLRQVAPDKDICVSTDSDQIINIVQSIGIEVPFKRPDSLSSDTAGSHGVILHALEFFENKGLSYDAVMVLQPTSPFRKKDHIVDMISEYEKDTAVDMVVSVGESSHNPYFTLFEENQEGYLIKSKDGGFVRSQDAPKVYFFNGSMYLINISSIKNTPVHQFTRVKKYEMDEISSMDIDTPLDWLVCETIIQNGMFHGL